MKKTLLALAFGLLTIVIVTSYASAQGLKDRSFAKNESFAKDPVVTGSTNNLPATTSVASGAINFKAVKHFSKDFKMAESVKWYKLDDGFVAYCTIKGDNSKVYYDKKGRLSGTLTYYDDKTMPHDLRSIVRSIYYDYKINLVQKVEVGNKIIYWINLEDAGAFKILRYMEGELEEVDDFKK